MWPGSTVVSCSSTASPVGSMPRITARVSPFAVFTTGRSPKGNVRCVESTGSPGDPGGAGMAILSWACAADCPSLAATASAAKLERATHRSRRFMGFMLRILLPPPRHIWHVLLGVSADGDHKVLRRNTAHVLHRVPGPERDIEDAARPDLLGDNSRRTLMPELRLALAHQDEIGRASCRER